MAHPDSEKIREDIFWGEITPSEHILQVYESEETLVDTLEKFVSAGLAAGECVVVIATTEHLKTLNRALKKRGLDVFSMALEDQYIPLKADETLQQFMVNGWPDENLFRNLVMNILARARKKNRRVRAFGEMVAVLLSQGYASATVRLEQLWNEYLESEAFSLLCAYPKTVFTEGVSQPLETICACHSKMICTPGGQTDSLADNHSGLQQKMAS